MAEQLNLRAYIKLGRAVLLTLLVFFFIFIPCFQGGYSEGVPMLIMGGLAMGAGLLSLTLPETLNQPMPETLSDLE